MGNISENCKCPKLFEELDRQGMKQNEFAKRIGASTGNVSDWASGKSSPTRRRWMTIAEVLGKPVDELMGTKKEPAGMGELDKQMQEIVELLFVVSIILCYNSYKLKSRGKRNIE